MTNEANMSTPVTRDELRDELAQITQRFEQVDQRFEQVDQRFEQITDQLTKMATKVDLENWGGALMDRVMKYLEQSEKRLSAELARHAQANYEASLKFLAAIDDKYTDLPKRVSRLEGAVFPYEPR
jgi:hypothetical protein